MTGNLNQCCPVCGDYNCTGCEDAIQKPNCYGCKWRKEDYCIIFERYFDENEADDCGEFSPKKDR